MPIPTDSEWKQALKKPFLKGVSDTGIGAKLRDWEKVATKDNEKKKKALEALIEVTKKNIKEYKGDKFASAQVYFADLVRDAEAEVKLVNVAIQKAKSATVESVLKKPADCTRFKEYLAGKGKKSLVQTVELWEICQKPPTDDAKMQKVCLKYRDLNMAFLGIWQTMQIDGNWKKLSQELTKDLAPFIKTFMEAG